MNINKQIYRDIIKCPKILKLKQIIKDKSEQKMKFDNTYYLNQIKPLADKLFDNVIDIKKQTSTFEGSVDLTNQLLKNEFVTIKSAVVNYENFSYTIPYVVKEKKVLKVYDIKCSTKCKQTGIVDFALLKYILNKLNFYEVKFFIININSSYVLKGDTISQQLLNINDITERVEIAFESFNPEVLSIETSDKLLDIKLHSKCFSPYECPYFSYCTKHLTKPNVFDLYDVKFEQKLELYNQNLISFNDLKNTYINKIQKLQIDTTLTNKTHIDSANIRKFINGLKYPLYFLDFETTQPIIPFLKNTKPHEQIPFQFSLHYIKRKGKKLKHKEFVGDGGDVRKKLAKKLCSYISKKGTVIVFDDSLERAVIKNLAKQFKAKSKKLTTLLNKIVDLSDIFQNGYYYNKDMGNSLSLKSILPSMFKYDPELSYETLSEIHNGNDAMSIYPKLKELSKADRIATKKNLLQYCKLDTLAMVKILEELDRITKNC